MPDSSKYLTFILKNLANNLVFNSIFDSIFDPRSSNSTLIHQFDDSPSTQLRLQRFQVGTLICQILHPRYFLHLVTSLRGKLIVFLHCKDQVRKQLGITLYFCQTLYRKDTEHLYYAFIHSLVSYLFSVSIHYLQCILCLLHQMLEIFTNEPEH